MKGDQVPHSEIIGDAHYQVRRHEENRPQGNWKAWRPPPVQSKYKPVANSPTREWILARLAQAPDGLTGPEIRVNSGLRKAALDAMYLTLLRTHLIQIVGNRAAPGGGRIARVYKLKPG